MDNKVQMFTQLIVELVFIKVKLLKVFSSSTTPMICTTTNSTTCMNLFNVTNNNALIENFIHNQNIGLGFIYWSMAHCTLDFIVILKMKIIRLECPNLALQVSMYD